MHLRIVLAFIMLTPSISLADIVYRCTPIEKTKQVSDLGLRDDDIDLQKNEVLVRSETALPKPNPNFIAAHFVGENMIGIRAPEQNSILQMKDGSYAKLHCTQSNSVLVNTATVD